MMMNLFNEQQGFRLHRLEIYNWGTFDKHVWVMRPEGQTAVLTGANGSGKSTVVDALLTLLVENRKRNYNLASGAESSRERSERSYIRGQYSRTRGADSAIAQPNTLRSSDTYSVLLAVFADVAAQRTVSIAQILWLSGSERVEHRYVVATCDLSIEQHFPRRNVRARDLPGEAQIFTTFKEYAATLRKALGLAGRPKALDLFNQTVAVKDIASLDQFVRDHMLDRGDPEEGVNGLREQYRELNEAHAAIQRAARQLEILEPLMAARETYQRYQQAIEDTQQARVLVPFYVADRAQHLLGEALQQLDSEQHAGQDKRQRADTELQSLRDQLQDVEFAIRQDEVGQMKREIERALPALEREIAPLRRAADRYDTYAQALDLQPYQDEEAFHGNRQHAQTMLDTTRDTIHELDSQRSQAQTQRHHLADYAKDLDREVKYLKANLSNIPQRVAWTRQQISEALNIPLEDLSFVGELLKIRDEAAEWEGALERLLHTFAQELLVPAQHYHRVSAYADDTNLRTRLIYRRVDVNQPAALERRQHENGQVGTKAYDKLRIHPQTPYHDWLASRLRHKFDYLCADSLADFQRAERAVSRQGQIKHGHSLHEKDDRRDLTDRRQYVLGWDNRAKLQEMQAEFADVQHQLKRLDEDIQHIEAQLDARRRDERALENLLMVQAFDEIDWRSRQAEYDRQRQRLRELDEQAQELYQLEYERDELKRQIDVTEQRRDQINAALTTLANRRAAYEQSLAEAQATLEQATAEHEALWERLGHIVQNADQDREALNLTSLSTRQTELDTALQSSINSLRGYLSRAESDIRDAMNRFRREHPEEGATLTADVTALPAYERIYERLRRDDLPQYQARFKHMLDRTVTRGVQAFTAKLHQRERDIERSIEELNESLAKVDYGGNSRIRLLAEKSIDPEIAEFRRELRACIPDAGDDSDEALSRAYERIQQLIARFDEDPNWTRRVIDVRRWRTFAAEQVSPEGQQLDYYSDSSGKSGGQKAKLAYTILASAIAHQYGLQDAGTLERSFHFVVIDEAFSKLDDDNARYAMKLFAQLSLQLLVVTPMQQLHVIEDEVEAYHVVVNNDEGSASRLFNLNRAQYRERRREFQVKQHA